MFSMFSLFQCLFSWKTFLWYTKGRNQFECLYSELPLTIISNIINKTTFYLTNNFAFTMNGDNLIAIEYITACCAKLIVHIDWHPTLMQTNQLKIKYNPTRKMKALPSWSSFWPTLTKITSWASVTRIIKKARKCIFQCFGLLLDYRRALWKHIKLIMLTILVTRWGQKAHFPKPRPWLETKYIDLTNMHYRVFNHPLQCVHRSVQYESL